jgi:arylsulfatase
MNGGGSHWADMKPLNLPDTMIYRNNGERLDELPEDFYSTRNYTDSLIHFIDKNKEDGNPWFGYLSYTAPHDPLHAPEEYIEKYKGMYDGGWDSLRMVRLQALKDVGLVNPSVNEFPENRMMSAWNTLPDEMKEELARDMEVYAAMVDYLDMSINRLFQFLSENDLYDNTLIVFFSDNGANGAPATAYPGNADGQYLGSFNNETENRGLYNSYIDMGPGWAQAVSGPFRMYKSFTSEGGIKSPMIIKAPGSTENGGQWNHSFLHVTDILPTFLEASGTTYPSQVKGKDVKAPIGKSIMPIISGQASTIREDEGMGYELFEMKAYIKGDWKILRMPRPFGNDEWGLYNLKDDPGEIHDVSDQYPEKKSELLEAYEQYLIRNEVFDHNGHFDSLYRLWYGVE